MWLDERTVAIEKIAVVEHFEMHKTLSKQIIHNGHGIQEITTAKKYKKATNMQFK